MAQKGREYSRWIDLTLNSHFEAVIPESYRTKVRFMSKSTCWGQQKEAAAEALELDEELVP